MKPITLLSALGALCSVATVIAGNVTVTSDGNIKVCTVYANGKEQDDVPNIMKAFTMCGLGGTVIFPEDQTYWIATKLNPIFSNVQIEWRGLWQVCYTDVAEILWGTEANATKVLG